MAGEKKHPTDMMKAAGDCCEQGDIGDTWSLGVCSPSLSLCSQHMACLHGKRPGLLDPAALLADTAIIFPFPATQGTPRRFGR